VPAAAAPAAAPEPFATLDDDLRVLREVTPAWMGIQFDALTPSRRARMQLGEGPQIVVRVIDGSPARDAGLVPGDVVLGPPGRPFTEEGEIKGWTMLLPPGQPQPLEVMRAGRRVELSLVPSERPLGPLPAAGPPKLSSSAPPLVGAPYRGPPADVLASKGPYLLFFWATWCAPCKESLPEVIAFGRERKIPVVAVTDEGRPELDAFFARWRTPFPDNVLSDEDRLSFYAYSVSGTPTFVLIDADKKVAGYTVGYTRARGLGMPGWHWQGR
jgi:cytochrome c biogenesis protein CcmG/thiol:disulfide interchange protein DsbE